MTDEHEDPAATAILRVEGVDGEPVIAREVVTKASPMPLWLAMTLIVLAVFSVLYTFNEQRERTRAFEAQNIANEENSRRVEGLVEDLQRQQERAEREKERLQALIIGLLSAETAEERRDLLEEFAEDTAEAERDDADEDRDDPPGQPSDRGRSTEGGSPPDPPPGVVQAQSHPQMKTATMRAKTKKTKTNRASSRSYRAPPPR